MKTKEDNQDNLNPDRHKMVNHNINKAKKEEMSLNIKAYRVRDKLISKEIL